MRQMDLLATVLLVVGALNWCLVAVARLDLVAAVFGMQFGERSAPTSVILAAGCPVKRRFALRPPRATHWRRR